MSPKAHVSFQGIAYDDELVRQIAAKLMELRPEWTAKVADPTDPEVIRDARIPEDATLYVWVPTVVGVSADDVSNGVLQAVTDASVAVDPARAATLNKFSKVEWTEGED